MALPSGRIARFTRVARKLAANVTDDVLIAAPGSDKHIVIDLLYFNTSVAGSVEFKQASGAWTDADGVLGGNFSANGGFIQVSHIELGDNKPLVWTTTGTAPVIYALVVYHLES